LPVRRDLVALVILDGWGLAPPGPGNAVELAETPVFDRLWADLPHAHLKASGEAVGLPHGQMGNSEVGHLTIGSGRVLFQDLMRINVAIENGDLFENPALVEAFRRAKERGTNVHLLGLVSYGGVHSHIDHLRALLELAEGQGMAERTWIHAFTDGRDVSPTSAVHDLAELPAEKIATVAGRYYAMDRDKRWERTERAVSAMTLESERLIGSDPDPPVSRLGEPPQRVGSDPTAAVRASYERGVTDEFIEPVVLEGRPRIGPGDVVMVFNFRPDRARQLTERLLASGFDVVTMTRYRDDLDCPVAFSEQEVPNTLS
jgi:2,3-bisphosphoglycerate-independent phosphoglycerate mutase